ncbi:hypothetical protein FF36_01904 [Frankia torreyi]|uniref:Uncharacterized protein n=1 Tax=Frankia torreyi TaxID=1856 RepID=A0A0D8BIA8_9ACTN|nr:MULTISPECIES: hypothetical protein [Frankia]KJE23719.1 hypothetical protein FF36_01904 [Frankia torreyi]
MPLRRTRTDRQMPAAGTTPPEHCAACGHPGGPTRPLRHDTGAWVHHPGQHGPHGTMLMPSETDGEY